MSDDYFKLWDYNVTYMSHANIDPVVCTKRYTNYHIFGLHLHLHKKKTRT